MIHIEVVTWDRSGYKCAHPECKKDPQYHDHILGEQFFLKQGEVVARVLMTDPHDSDNRVVNFYCRGCIHSIYELVKTQLDTNLWAFL